MFGDEAESGELSAPGAQWRDMGAESGLDDAQFESVSDVYDLPADAVDDHLWMHDDGRVWDLGPAEVDTDADGINDSLTRNGPDGLTVYTDSDRDGQVDKITEIGRDGEFRSSALDPDSGRWVPTDSGRIG